MISWLEYLVSEFNMYDGFHFLFFVSAPLACYLCCCVLLGLIFYLDFMVRLITSDPRCLYWRILSVLLNTPVIDHLNTFSFCNKCMFAYSYYLVKTFY
jgi:hypothetical protein